MFGLTVNDGRSDRLLLASKLLSQRIRDTMCVRRSQGFADITPTLQDLERTHLLWINAHFKPHAAIAHEYGKVRPQSGSTSCGGGVTFSIPQFGDFFHDMVTVLRIDAFKWANQATPLRGSGVFPLNNYDPNPTLLDGQQVNTYYNLVDACGNLVVAGGDQPTLVGTPYRNLARYCEYPANKIIRAVRFDVNGNPLDAYSDNISLMLEKFCVPRDKRFGYDRLAGQEVPMYGYGGLKCCPIVDSDSTNTPNDIYLQHPASTQGVFDGAIFGGMSNIIPSNPLTGIPVDFMREKKKVYNGPQTPKPIQPMLELWHKHKFWFNEDVRLSIASVAIPYGQRYISLDLARADELIFEECNLFREEIEETITCLRTAPGLPAFSTKREKRYYPIFQQSPPGYEHTNLNIAKMELNINNIFVNPEVHDIYIKRIHFSLIRVYREQVGKTNLEANDERLLSSFKWPVEYIFIGIRPQYNTNINNRKRWRDWHRLTRMLDAQCDEPQRAEIAVQASGDFGPISNAGHESIISNVNPDEYGIPVQTINSLSLNTHGIDVFQSNPSSFYHSYAPFHYGDQAIMTPKDPGALFVNFALKPRCTYQPSGHLNISRARETYVKWETSYVSCKTPGELIAIAIAINFLLITDGSAVLRYST